MSGIINIEKILEQKRIINKLEKKNRTLKIIIAVLFIVTILIGAK